MEHGVAVRGSPLWQGAPMHRLKTLLLNIGHAFHEACVCLLLGLRSSLRVGILLRSSLLCLLMFLFTTWLFYAYFQEIGFVDRKSTRLNSSHVKISYAVFCLKKKKT